MQKKTWLKILVPILIAAVICAMWFVKNPPKEAVSLMPEDNVFCLTESGPIDYEALSAYGLPILVDYGSDACIPCIQMAPVLEKLNAEMQGKAFIKFVDVRQYYEATSNMPVQLIPSQFFSMPMALLMYQARTCKGRLEGLKCIPKEKSIR